MSGNLRQQTLTTNFVLLRGAHHFDILAERLKKHTGRNPVRIWCSAASTGEEPAASPSPPAKAFNR